MTPDVLDAVVVGAGFSGLAALHLLRERGLRVHGVDAAANVGGTWWWHAYPGSHLDSEGHLYQYFFAEQLFRDWGWSERHPAGYEVQRWLRFAADRLDLRRHLSLATRVVGARHDDGAWTLHTERGDVLRARHLVACTGRLPVEPDLDVSAFAGEVLRTADWREDTHDLTGRRVGLVGTTAAAIQLAPTVVEQVAHLTVVADGPRDVVPRDNPVYGWMERDAYKAGFETLRDAPPDDAPPAPDRAAMRARLADDRLVRLLVPDGAGARPVRDDNWLELFARGDVDLVERADVRVVADGLAVRGGVVGLDVLVVTDEFDAGPPALTRLGVAPDAPGLHHVVAPVDGLTHSFDLLAQVRETVEAIAG
ncbi:flavin-containing monooxygenase [Actinomycetospora atypica]|uniref:Flavin-containing monooxygenase n=1 Tax=Actinomycetospora atypica TaxID=1290095 RepID=A0ABV9YP00_9PSEU